MADRENRRIELSGSKEKSVGLTVKCDAQRVWDGRDGLRRCHSHALLSSITILPMIERASAKEPDTGQLPRTGPDRTHEGLGSRVQFRMGFVAWLSNGTEDFDISIKPHQHTQRRSVCIINLMRTITLIRASKLSRSTTAGTHSIKNLEEVRA